MINLTNILKQLLLEEKTQSQINDIFEIYPELKTIGTPQQYSQYLNTIFPNSKIKNIVYHGTMEHLVPTDGKFKGYVTYFTDVKNYAQTVGANVNKKIVSAVIDIKNPYIAPSEIADVPKEIHDTDEYTNPRIIKSSNNKYDSVIGIDAGQKEGRTIAVFEPEQIHVLGSKYDIEQFKKFVSLNK